MTDVGGHPEPRPIPADWLPDHLDCHGLRYDRPLTLPLLRWLFDATDEELRDVMDLLDISVSDDIAAKHAARLENPVRPYTDHFGPNRIYTPTDRPKPRKRQRKRAEVTG